MKKKFEAIFLDRDGTLSHNDPEKHLARDRAMAEIIGDEDFRITGEMMIDYVYRAGDACGPDNQSTLAGEAIFWRKWYQLILEDHGVTQNSEALAAELYERFCFHKMMQPYPETVRVLEALKKAGFKMGVISDTAPSLQESLAEMGIARYFQSFIASAVVGAMKPDPKIFRAATESLGVKPKDSVFVDDCKEEVDGAREQGFTALWLDRTAARRDFQSWMITNLEDLLEFLGLEYRPSPTPCAS